MKLDRLRTRRDREQAARLVADCFSPRHALLERIFLQAATRTPGTAPEHVRVVRHDNRIAALLVIYEKKLRIGRARLKMGGLGFVCSGDPYRGRGWASACVRDAIRQMRADAFHCSLLFGIDRFYTRFGYVGCLPEYRLGVPVHVLNGLNHRLGVRDAVLKDLPGLLKAYQGAACDCHASAERTVDAMREGLLRRELLPRAPGRDNRVVVFHPKREAGMIRGYLAWMDGQVREAGLAHGDFATAAAMLAWLRDQRREAVEKEIVLPHGTAHPLTQYALRFNHAFERRFNWSGGGMGRLINAGAFVEALQPELELRLNRAGVDGQCHVHVVLKPEGLDPARASSYTLRLGAGHHFMLSHRPHYWLKIECTAQTLLQLALGSLPLAALPDLVAEGERSLVPVLFPPADPELFGLDHF